MSTSAPDPVTLALYRHRFEGIADEMGATLRRTSYSPNIKERLDFSCALFDASGAMVAQAAHIPVHLGAMPASMDAALAAFDTWHPGDIVLLNDPYAGGTHLPDITMISPVFFDDDDQPSFFVASRAHHADVGGMTPGSLPLSTEIYQEGLIIPPIKLYARGACNEAVLALLLRNVRTPDERRGDLDAQRAAHAVGAQRLHAVCATYGAQEVITYATHLQAYSARRMRAAIAAWPQGRYAFADTLVLDHLNPSHIATIHVAAHIEHDGVTFDFASTSRVVPGSLNAVRSITQAACYYAVRGLCDDDIPVNAGCFSPIHIVTPPNSVVDAHPPAAVAGGNVETSQRIVDVVLGALAQALPERVPAASQGTMNNLTMGGLAPDGTPFAYYETIAGGMGAHANGPGLSGTQVHMTNTLNTPAEALERAYPMRIWRYALRAGSGGVGQHRGGGGLIREYEVLVPTTITLLTTRRQQGAYGLAGGHAGAPGRNIEVQPEGTEIERTGLYSGTLAPHTRLRIETPGGGGWGTPPNTETTP
ncbi:MAG: hydantoinase B/oxoprolinase family protein [Rhodothermales bacterium]